MTSSSTTGGIGDECFERYARMVRRLLDVPTALVTILEPDRQVFPGAVGLPEPWQSTRETPLTHSFCQYVVADRGPLVITDARVDARLKDNLAIPDLGVIAYAGFPLRDASGDVVGSLCAIDSVPHAWTERELLQLEDLALSCSAELALRQETQRADESERRARTLLALSEALANTVTLAQIAAALHHVATKHLGCHQAGIWINRDERLFAVVYEGRDWPQAMRNDGMPVERSNPLGRALRHRLPAFYPERAALLATFPDHPLAEDVDDNGARAVLPLVAAGRSIGVLALQWSTEHLFTPRDRDLMTALATYTAQAVARAELVAASAAVNDARPVPSLD